MEFRSHIVRNPLKESVIILIPLRYRFLFFFSFFLLVILLKYGTGIISFILFACACVMMGLSVIYIPKRIFNAAKRKLQHLSNEDSFKITTNHILLGNKVYPLDLIKDIHISIHAYFGEKETMNSFTIKSEIKAGDRNIISFNCNDKDFNVEFYIKSKSHLNELGALLYLWHSTFLFEEKYNGQKTHGLKKLSYKEIQELKAKRENN